jgi:hypothetical protein
MMLGTQELHAVDKLLSATAVIVTALSAPHSRLKRPSRSAKRRTVLLGSGYRDYEMSNRRDTACWWQLHEGYRYRKGVSRGGFER